MRQRYHTSYAKIRAASLLAVLGCAGNAMAATRSFDYNSSSAGSGVVYNGDYFWDATSTLWNDSSGTGTSTAWAAGDSAVFCAGTDVQSFALYDVHISANHVVNSITVEEGQPTFVNAGGSLTLTGAATISTTGGGDTLIQAPIAGSAGLVKDGPGTLYLSGMNT